MYKVTCFTSIGSLLISKIISRNAEPCPTETLTTLSYGIKKPSNTVVF